MKSETTNRLNTSVTWALGIRATIESHERPICFNINIGPIFGQECLSICQRTVLPSLQYLRKGIILVGLPLEATVRYSL